MSIFTPDQARANEMLDRILLASRTGQSVFADYAVPQQVCNYPVNLGDERDIANFLSGSLLHQSGGCDAWNSMRGHRRLYERHPEIYDPRMAINYTADEIALMMSSVGLTHTTTRPMWLLHNAKILNKYWGGDPRNIFRGLPKEERAAWEELRRRVAIPRDPNKLLGFQDKVLSLNIHLFVDAGLIDERDAPPPTDTQVDRTVAECVLIGIKGGKVGPWKQLNEYQALIREMFREYSASRGVRMLEIGEAVWFYAREKCKFAPEAYTQNGVHVGVQNLSADSKVHRIVARDLTHADVCGSCIISDLCEFVVPHVERYNRKRRQGGLLLVPRQRLEGEEPQPLDPVAPLVPRCTRHRGHYFDPDKSVGCIDCGRCAESIGLPKKIERELARGKTPTIAPETREAG